jgi:hypothetical protein
MSGRVRGGPEQTIDPDQEALRIFCDHCFMSTPRKATGWSTQLARQTGEHLVVAELGRLGYAAAPYAGNVPLFDVLAADARGYSVPIQVKTIKQPSWQLNAEQFLAIEIVDGRQTIKRKKPLPNPKILCVFVLLRDNEAREADEFYVIHLQDLQDLIARDYTEMLIRHGGRRPKKPDSTHCTVRPEQLRKFRDRWDLLQTSLPPVSTADLQPKLVKLPELLSRPPPGNKNGRQAKEIKRSQ